MGLGKMEGVRLDTDVISIYTTPAELAYSAGQVFTHSSTNATEKVASDGPATYILMNDVTADGPSFEEKITNLFVDEIKAGDPVNFLRIKPGDNVEVDADAFTGFTSTTALLTDVEVASGKFQAKDTGTKIAELIANNIATTGYVKLHFVAVE